MIERKVALVAFTVAVLIPQAMRAQVASTLETGALRTSSQSEAVPSDLYTVAPNVRYDWSLLSLSAHGSAWLDGSQWQLADEGVHATFQSPTLHSVNAEVLSNANRAFDARSLGTDQMDVQTRVQLLIKQHGGVWVGAGTARPWRVAVVSAVDVANLGVWGQYGSTNVTTTFTHYNFTKSSLATPASDQTTCAAPMASLPQTDACREQTHFSDLETSAKWEFLGVEYAGTAGYRFGSPIDVSSDSRSWATATATIWVAPRAAIVMSGGKQPANPARAVPAQTFGSLGMVFAYLPAHTGVPVAADQPVAVRSFDIRPVANGMQRILIRIGSVESVDVIGDFSDWEPIKLVRRGTDLWELQLPMDVGAHHINVRVDGGNWSVPPGLPTIKDGFGGEVGLLVIG